ncbi:hypothetical protein BJY01DRAFT_257746 [Aspergillus pseudoustus]|uniref:C2H2-type domain-containing protein n=1 Tax=Aspergillus pseudoustus TaxID=1810923 RepID=A0ABR4JHA0_9EURO
MRNHDIAARKCAHCHRVFSKVEHLRRHQRSHTGERPFKCKHCGRKYARSDVLNRHVRHHHPVPGEANGADQPAPEDIRQDTSSTLLDAEYDEVEVGSASASSQDPSTSPQDTATAEQANSEPLHIQDSIDQDWQNIQFDVAQDMNAPYTEELCGFIDGGCDIQATDGVLAQQPTTAPNHQPEFNPQQPVFDLSIELPEAPGYYNMGDVMPSNVDFGSVLDGLLLTPPGSGDQQPRQPSKTNISNEQFEQVRRLWPTRRRTASLPLSPVCWDDVLLHPEDNIFSSPSLTALASLEQPTQTDSCWKFTDACRGRLLQSLSHNYTPHTDQAMTPVHSPSNHRGWEDGLPPTDILDLCLDLYFHRFHVHMPFVHPPTFNASATPSLLLFPMCLVGMMILNRGMARKMIAHYLPGVIQKCRAELAAPGLRHSPAPALLTVVASASLILFIAASTAEMAFEEQRQALYEETLLLARSRGLLCTPSYHSALIQAVEDTDATWKAWARIQSAQRLTACVVLADVYSSQMLGMAPALSPREVQIPLLRDDNLFTLHDCRKWSSLISPEGPWSGRPSLAPLPAMSNYPPGLTDFGVQTLLAITWLRILKCKRSHPSSSRSENTLWTSSPSLDTERIEADSPSSICACLPLIFKTYETTLRTGNANSLVLWHYLCLSMTTNLSVIEDAAGRNGPEAAKEAVDSLKTWAKTPAARRACLHAIQALLAISEHRQCDGVMLHTEMALFNAGLVMGFYLLTTPKLESNVATPCYELFDAVDWVDVGELGFSTANPPSSPQGDVSSSSSYAADSCESASAACSFIRNGGPVCFRGAEYHSSYGAARRSFMNFAAQLEEIGRWNIQEYCKVLRIISDTLFINDEVNPNG